MLSTIGWDGTLPFVVASCPIAVQILFPRADIEPIVAVFVPIGAACWRAAIAQRQLTRTCHGRAPLGRQLALAAAIVLLLLFEILASTFVFAFANVPPEAWCIPAACYAAYLACICWALRPERRASSDPDLAQIANL